MLVRCTAGTTSLLSGVVPWLLPGVSASFLASLRFSSRVSFLSLLSSPIAEGAGTERKAWKLGVQAAFCQFLTVQGFVHTVVQGFIQG